MNTEQKCCDVCKSLNTGSLGQIDRYHYCLDDNCPCHTEQKGWREGYWDIFLQEFEMSDFARFAIKKEIERTLQEYQEELVRAACTACKPKLQLLNAKKEI